MIPSKQDCQEMIIKFNSDKDIIALKEKYKEDGSTEEKTNVGIGSLMHKFDLSLMLGAGYQFNCGANVSANYNIGLTNMYKNSGDGPKVKSKNGVFQINVGYRF